MIKQLIILAQLLGLFFYQLLFTGDLTVTQKLQNTVVQGQEAVVEITINKADLPGFAKVQQDFPDGFTAEPIETKGATFSFKDNKLKFIWMSLPEEKVFTISYKIVANETVEGDFTLGGKFSFISESERKNVEIPVSKFTVVKDVKKEEPALAVVTSEEAVAPIFEEVAEEEVVEEVNEEIVAVVEETEEEAKEEEVIAPVENTLEEKVSSKIVAQETEKVTEVVEKEESKTVEVNIACKRSVKSLGDGKFRVSIEITKEGIEGFCKITEKIPAGFVANEDDSKNGVFSFKNNTMKILWMGAPEEEAYAVSYFIQAGENKDNGSFDIIGFYSYLENEATSKYIIEGTNFNLNRVELVAEEPVIVTPPKEEVVKKEVTPKVEEQVVEEEVIAEVVEKEKVEETEIVEPVAAKDAITSTPSPEGNVTYKVQVGAGHEKVPSTYFATMFKLQDKVSTINHEGWIKYLVGSYGEYKSARDKRNTVRGNVKTAFVTAYNSGTRITVQEALMISNQKWYK